jgi:hypothetical protein
MQPCASCFERNSRGQVEPVTREQDDPVESGALEPDDEGGAERAEPQQDPVESGALEDDE